MADIRLAKARRLLWSLDFALCNSCFLLQIPPRMSAQGKKLLLIGATGYDRAKDGLRLDCVRWDRLSDVQNVRDYDVLVLNLLSIRTETARTNVDWTKFNQLLDFPAASDILIHKGQIVILGDPRFQFNLMDGAGLHPFLEWTGAHFVWDNQPGDTVKVNDSSDFIEFKDYSKHLRKWQYSLRVCHQNSVVFHERWDSHAFEQRGWSAQVKVYPACVNRYSYALAFCIRHLIGNKHEVGVPYGLIYFLPEISLDEDETLLIVLRDFCDAASELPEPEWVSGFNVPGQKAIDDRIAKIKMALAEQQAALEMAVSDRVKARVCLKLLYEREYALDRSCGTFSASLELQSKNRLRRTRRMDGLRLKSLERRMKGFSKSRAQSPTNLARMVGGKLVSGLKEGER